MKKQIATWILAAVGCSLVLGGCGLQRAAVSSAQPIRIFMEQREEAPISSDMAVVRELEKRCNVSIELEVYSKTEAPQKFKSYLASQDGPDIFIYNLDQIHANYTAFVPLTPYIGEKTPNLKKYLVDDSETNKELAMLDGQIYAMPMIASERVSQVYFARSDWMEKLGLSAPQTLDDFYGMLVAMRDGDPNGNGEKDEIPFVTRYRKNGLMQFLEPFGIEEEFFVENEKIVYGAADPRMKDALDFIRRLYQQQLIDPEYIAADAKSWQSKVTENKAGVLFDWVSRIDFYNTQMPEAEFRAFLPPSADGNPKTHYQMPTVRGSGAAAVNKNSKQIQKIIRLYDYIYSDEGTRLLNFGLEDEHYKMENGQPKYTDKVLNNTSAAPQIALWQNGIAMDWPLLQDKGYEQQLLSPVAQQARELYNPIILPSFPRLKFTKEESQELAQLLGDIRIYKDEMIDRFIIGTNSLEEFETYRQRLQELGIERVLEIYNEAYARYKR